MRAKISLFIFLYSFFLLSCQQKQEQKALSEIETYGQHYQKHKDYESLNKVVELMALQEDTSYVSSILGEPINMGFDYRYLIDSIGAGGCVMGAVFHIGEGDKIDQKWLDEICE